MTQKIFPRNLTARTAVKIAGNPVTTRLESGVGNCFPGLEFDHRNLDRRFFPGLVFNFGVTPPVLASTDDRDPALADQAPNDAQQLSAAVTAAFDKLGQGEWRLTSLTQGGRTIDLQALANTQQFDAASFWRFARSLTRDKVTIVLTQTPATAASRQASQDDDASPTAPVSVTLTHYRRQYVDPDTGVISAAYLPGELTQSLCSPWMHDFRDCACNYWAANHPDIVLGVDEGFSAKGPAGADPDLAVRPLDWLRADRDSRAAATESPGGNNAFRLRHYQINQEWTSLAFVLEGRENHGLYAPGFEAFAAPFATAEALADELVSLCGLEHVVLLEYLYAYYSLKKPEDFTDPRNAADALFVRHELLGIAASEMRHLRWANQLLWTLAKLGLIRDSGPSLEPGRKVPTATGERDRQLRPLALPTLEDFIAVERPSGTLDGAYARVVATLRMGYPEPLLQLARQIVAEGMDHYNRFREIGIVLRSWPGVRSGTATPWLRPVQVGSPAAAGKALELYRGILRDLADAYRRGDMEDAGKILDARQQMMALDEAAEQLAANGVGIPFF
jgi:Ferritin-like